MEELIYKDIQKIFSGVNPPYSFLFLDELDKNLVQVKERSGDKLIRLATKSIRSVPVLRYLVQNLGERCSGLMCFHLEEVLWLCEQLETSFLMGYPQTPTLVQAQKLAAKISDGARIIQMVDSLEQVAQLDDLAQKNQCVFDICLDLDMSLKLPGLNFGVFRSPVDSKEKVDLFFSQIKNFSNIRLVGLMGYEAQIAGVGDKIYKNPIMNGVIGVLKKLSHKKIYGLRAYATQVAQKNFSLDFVNGGGSGSLEMTARDHAVTEVTAGSAFYAPALFDSYRNRFYPSMGYAMAIQRKPKEGFYTVHGGGYVASGALGREKLPVIFSPKGAQLHQNEMAGEVQTPVYYNGLQKLEIGDPIFFRHSKAGELLERFKSFYVVKEGAIIDQWESYRGANQCFL